MPQDLKDHIIEWDGKDEVGSNNSFHIVHIFYHIIMTKIRAEMVVPK